MAASGIYTVSASKDGVIRTGHIVLSVLEAPPSPFAYAELVCCKLSTIPVARPVGPYWAGGDYSVTPSLPSGLYLDRATGTVSGTPFEMMAASEYTVKVRKGFELATATLRITIHDRAPVHLSYSGSGDYVVGIPAPDRLPYLSGGRATAYSVEPALPAGLTLDAASGLIGGTPQVAAAEASYTVTASNPGGRTTCVLRLKVEAALQAPIITLASHITAHKGFQTASVPYLGYQMTYLWTISGGSIIGAATSNSITFNSGDPGPLKVSVTVQGPRGKATAHASALIVPKPLATLSGPGRAHPGDAWRQARVPDLEGMTYHWSLKSILAKPEIRSGQGTAKINLNSGDKEGSFELQVNVQNQAGDHASAARTIEVKRGIWVSKEARANPWTIAAPASATLLPDGRVLVLGGQFMLPGAEPRTQVSAALYDADRGVWTATDLPLEDAFLFHTATLVRGQEVLVVGETQAGPKVARFDAVKGAWQIGTLMKTPRRGHTATLLKGGDKVLVVGGRVPKAGTDLHDAECYDLDHDHWTVVAPTLHRRNGHTATLLENGHVLVAGGLSDAAGAEVYDPTKDRWTLAGNLNRKRVHHTATRLPNGTVLVAGGEAPDAAATAELFEPGSGKWTLTGGLSDVRRKHTATLLDNGKVLVAGGAARSSGEWVRATECYDPGTSRWEATGWLESTMGREQHGATLLQDGTVLAVLGVNTDLAAERYMVAKVEPKAAPKPESKP